MSKYARADIKNLKAYVPGEQPGAERKIIKLNTNENPYPPSPAVRMALRKFSADKLRKYPEPAADSFRRTAGTIFEIDPEMIITGNGSDELLAIILRAFVEQGEIVAYPSPTYSLYPVLAGIQGGKVVEIPFDEGFELPESLGTVRAKVIFIANPNAPSGTFVQPAKIAKLAKKTRGIVVVDEAYADFADDNCLSLAKRLANVIVLRTLSKSYSLAGLRFGFAVAAKPLIADMMKVKDSYNCDAVSTGLAIEAIRDQRYFQTTIAKIRRERGLLAGKLKDIGFIVTESQANFLWARIKKPSAKSIYLSLKESGVLVRYFDKKGLRDSLRITVGKPAENRILIATLSEIIRGK